VLYFHQKESFALQWLYRIVSNCLLTSKSSLFTVTTPQTIMDPSLAYNLFGFGVLEPVFTRRLSNSELHEQLDTVAHRICFVDRLRYRQQFVVGESFSTPELLHRLSVERQALELYLLCTCIDALAGEDFIRFHEWLGVKKRATKTKYGIDDDLIGQVLSRFPGDLRDPDRFRSAAFSLFNEAYLPNHGNHKAFLRFFDALPASMKSVLLQVYTISDPLDEDEISPELKEGAVLPNDIETWNREREKWESQRNDERIKKVAQYLYQYHRNPYTHSAVSRKPRTTTDWSKILGVEVGNEAWDPIGDIIKLGLKYRIVRFGGIPGEDEALMLRLVVATGWVQRLGLPVDEDFVVGFRNDQIRRERMHAAMYELEIVLDLLRFYTGENKDRSPYKEILSFQQFPTENVENLKGYLYDTPLHDEAFIEDYLSRLKRINHHILEFNRENVPQFPDILAVTVEEQASIRKAKEDAYPTMQKITLQEDIRKLAIEIYKWLDLLADRMI
jgi:hypothetical protein